MKENQYRQKIRGLVKKILRERSKHKRSRKDLITVGWPMYDEREILRAFDTLLDIRISQGPSVREFEESFANYLGVKYAVAVNSGSSANLLALAALIESGDVPKGSEVIIPAATFATVSSPISQLGLVPVYVDVEADTWNIDPKQIEKAITKKTKVVMPVHSFGNPADMAKIMRIVKKRRLYCLEDCCEAHGARIGSKKVGSFGDLSTLSFFVAHNITTGEGGMIFTNNKRYRDILRSLREFGRLPNEVAQKYRFTYKDPILKNYDARYIFTRLGYNMRMTDIEASLGIEQLKKLDFLNALRLCIVKKYQVALEKYSCYLQLPTVRPGNFHSFYGYLFLVRKNAPFTRQELVLFLEKKGIETRAFFGGCLPDQPAFRGQKMRVVGQLPVSRYIRDNAIFIGCHPAITDFQVKHVINSFEEFFNTL